MNSYSKVKYGIEFKLMIIISCLIIISTIAATLFWGLTADEGKRGTFGDMFGAANALFTGLSFVGLIVTILLQRKDLNIQREELQKQTESIKIQNFENTFFQMLTIFHGIVDSLEIEGNGNVVKGRKVFSFLHNKINKKLYDFTTTEEYQKRCNYLIEDIIRYTFIKKEDAINIYDEVYQEYSDVLGHYFRAFLQSC